MVIYNAMLIFGHMRGRTARFMSLASVWSSKRAISVTPKKSADLNISLKKKRDLSDVGNTNITPLGQAKLTASER